MYFLYAEERSAYIARCVLPDEARTLSSSEYASLRDTVLSIPGKNTVIIDLESIYEDAEELVKKIQSIRTVAPYTEFVIFASGYDPDSRAVTLLASSGIGNIITSLDQSGMKEELEGILRGEAPHNAVPSAAEERPVTEPLSAPDDSRRMSVAVVGSMPRIGTTTQALQICRSMIYLGYTSCYLEMNSKGFLGDMKDIYEVTQIPEGIRVDGLDMYSQSADIPSLKEKYQVVVCDYGDVVTGINYLSFAEKDHRYCVVGISPSEQKHIGEALRKLNASKQHTDLIFSFASDSDERNIADQMKQDRSIGWHIAPYTPEPFAFDMRNAGIFGEELDGPEKPKKKGLKAFLKKVFPW